MVQWGRIIQLLVGNILNQRNKQQQTEKLKLKRLPFNGGLDFRFGEIVLLVLFSEMDSAVLVLPLNYTNPNELYSQGHKRIKTSSDAQNCSSTSSSVGMKDESKEKKSNVSQNVMDYSNPFAIQDMLDRLDSERFGSVTDEIKELINNKMQILGPHIAKNTSKLPSQKAFCDLIDIDDDCLAVDGPSKPLTVVVLSDDEEEEPDKKPYFPFQEVVLMQPPAGQSLSRDIEDDLGYVCRICGVIERRIETIIDVQFNKVEIIAEMKTKTRDDRASEHAPA
ncbi:hypothetical protein Ddye_003967 [Dipteronia dyeriana]|uniref:Uncharacterized protein n=1 Tax=Dipteronia dyeriana TaxID=168575 RepID=A0AAD9XUN1_9ROSI|nr:hypothetical protein Ddye_003967 [Dipteronia dyeriana]